MHEKKKKESIYVIKGHVTSKVFEARKDSLGRTYHHFNFTGDTQKKYFCLIYTQKPPNIQPGLGVELLGYDLPAIPNRLSSIQGFRVLQYEINQNS
jgi:hypothetical protein